MNFNNKYLKKYSTFKLQLQDEVRQEQPTFPENWVQEQLQPTLVQFLNVWHGSEVRRLSFYVEETPLKVYGAVEYSLELRHKIDPQNPETFKVSGYSFNFFPTDSDPSEKSPFETWEQLNAQKKLVKYPEVSGMRAAVAFSEGVNGAISIVNTLKDIGTVIYQAVSAKKEKNDKRLAAINEAGHDLDVIFKGTCNVFIHKNTDKHKSFPNFYGVLFEDTFTIENTSYKVYVFREGTFSINEKCRREHHWFATGEDNNFARLSFWRKRLYTFWSPKRSFHFERQGKILTDSQLEKAIQLADNYFKPASTTPENPSDKRPQPNGA